MQNDQAAMWVMKYLLEHRGEKVNENKLSLQKFRRWNIKEQKWGAPYSAATVSRKGRLLGALSLIERGHDKHHHTWYSWK